MFIIDKETHIIKVLPEEFQQYIDKKKEEYLSRPWLDRGVCCATKTWTLPNGERVDCPICVGN